MQRHRRRNLGWGFQAKKNVVHFCNESKERNMEINTENHQEGIHTEVEDKQGMTEKYRNAGRTHGNKYATKKEYTGRNNGK